MPDDVLDKNYKVITEISFEDLYKADKSTIKEISYDPEISKSIKEIDNSFPKINTEFAEVPILELSKIAQSHIKKFAEQGLELSKLASAAITPYADILNNFKVQTNPILEHFTKIQNPLKDYIQNQWIVMEPLIRQTQLWQDQLNSIASAVSIGAKDLLKRFPEGYFVRIKLESEYWIIVDNSLLIEIGNREDSDVTSLSPIVVEYYKKDDWAKLERMITNWTPLVDRERHRVFKSALCSAKQSTQDVHLLTVPAIIAQIDGLNRELYSFLPTEIKKKIEKEIKEKFSSELSTEKRPNLRPSIEINAIAEIVDYWSATMFEEIIFGGLFRDSKDIKSEENYALFRHKIMHGDKSYLKQQDEESFVRLILFTDFIINLIEKIKASSKDKQTTI